MNSKRAVAQLLKHLSAIGVTHLPKVDLRRVASPTDRKTVTVRSAGAVAGTIRQSGSPEGRPANRSPSRQAADLPVTPVASANSGQEKSPPPRTFDSMFRTQSEIQTESAARPTPHSETQTLMKQNWTLRSQPTSGRSKGSGGRKKGNRRKPEAKTPAFSFRRVGL